MWSGIRKKEKPQLSYHMNHVMLYCMARSESGRIVLEIDPARKDELYTALTADGLTLKEWFLRQTADYLQNRSQPSLFGSSLLAERWDEYRAKPARKQMEYRPPTRNKR